jgi:hypothetical protein
VTRWDARRKYARANGGAGAGDARSRATGDARSARAVDTIFRSFLDVLAASEGRVLNCMTRRDARDVGRRGGSGDRARARESARAKTDECVTRVSRLTQGGDHRERPGGANDAVVRGVYG